MQPNFKLVQTNLKFKAGLAQLEVLLFHQIGPVQFQIGPAQIKMLSQAGPTQLVIVLMLSLYEGNKSK